MAPHDHSPQRPRLFAVSLVLSVVFHSIVVLGVVVGTWLWGRAVYYRPPSRPVSLMEAPIAIRPLTAAEARRSLPDTTPQPPPAKPKGTAPKRTAKPRVATTPKRTAKPRIATAAETRARIARLRARQAQEQQRAERAQQAAADRIAALRVQVQQQAIGAEEAAETASRVQRIRLQAYQGLVRAKISAAWILPLPPAETRDLHAMVSLRVGRRGEVTQLKVLQSSGHALFDASFLRAIESALPLPILPADYEGEFLDIELRFSARDS